jgi:hypothetical protein
LAAQAHTPVKENNALGYFVTQCFSETSRAAGGNVNRNLFRFAAKHSAPPDIDWDAGGALESCCVIAKLKRRNR